MDEIKRSFPPVVDDRTRVLVLGSLPGEESLARRQYYGNPRNHFWRLMSAVIGVELVPLDYEARLETLLEAGVGLWDTVGAAARTARSGSTRPTRFPSWSPCCRTCGRWRSTAASPRCSA